MRADARVGGHFVQGHVDATGTIADVAAGRRVLPADGRVPRASLPPLIVPKGSIAVDGISLTVAAIDDARDRFDVQIIPFTWRHTKLHAARSGDAVNLECDILGKYVARALARRTETGRTQEAARIHHDAQEAQAAASRSSRRSTQAIEAIRDGKMIIVVDDEDRENEGDLTIAAEKITPEVINFMAKYGRGLICMPMTEERLEELDIPQMVEQNTARFDTAFCVSIEAKGVTSTGISASDRAATVLAAIDPATRPADLARPGHMFPLKARNGGVLVRAGQTEAAVDLARIAGPVSGRRHLRNHERRRDDGARAGADEVREAAQAADDHDRGSDPVPDAHRGAGPARRVGGAADRARSIPRASPTRASSTARRTSRWSRGRSATART